MITRLSLVWMEYEGSIVEDDNNPHPQAVYVVGIVNTACASV